MEESKRNFKDLLRDLIIPKVEMISIGILVIALILKYLSIGATAPMIGIGLTTLAVTSYLLAFLYKSEGKLIETITIKVGFISSSILIIGVMFNVLLLPGAPTMLNIGAATLGIATVVAVFQLFQQPPAYMKHIVIRYITTFSIGLLVIFNIL